MSEEKKLIDDGGPAFPVSWNENTPGKLCAITVMSRRQWLAGLAMQGMIAGSQGLYVTTKQFAKQSYALADAIIQFEKSEAENER